MLFQANTEFKNFPLNLIPDGRGEVQICTSGEIFEHRDDVPQVVLLNVVVSAEQSRDVDYGHGVDVGELLAGRRYRDEAAVEGVPNVVSEQAEVVDLPEPCESDLIFYRLRL